MHAPVLQTIDLYRRTISPDCLFVPTSNSGCGRLYFKDLPFPDLWIEAVVDDNRARNIGGFSDLSGECTFLYVRIEGNYKYIAIKKEGISERFQLEKKIVESALNDSNLSLIVRLIFENSILRYHFPKDVDSKANKAIEIGNNSLSLTIDKIIYLQDDLMKHGLKVLRGHRISKKYFPIPRSATITPDGAFIDQPGVLGKGRDAKVKPCLQINGKECVRRVVTFRALPNPDSLKKVLSVINNFNNVPNILSTLGMVFYPGKLGNFKLVTFHQRYYETLDSLIKNEKKLSLEVKLSIVYQTLVGLNEIAKFGSHDDISKRNILVHSTKEGDYNVVISDLWDFCNYSEQVIRKNCFPDYFTGDNLAVAPELLIKILYRNPKIFLGKADVFQLGSCLCDVFFPETPRPWQFFKKNGDALYLQNVEKQVATYFSETSFPDKIKELLQNMVVIDPHKRWSASECLAYFRKYFPEIQI